MAAPTYQPYRPARHPVPEPELPVVRHGRSVGCGGRGGVRQWLFVSGICVVIWALTGAGYFWPMWVMLGLGMATFKGRR